MLPVLKQKEDVLLQFVLWMLVRGCQRGISASPASFTFPEVAEKYSISLSM